MIYPATGYVYTCVIKKNKENPRQMKSGIEFSAVSISALYLFACANGRHAPFAGEPALVRKITSIGKRLEKAVLASPFPFQSY
jgi:hypothetical protein